MRDASGFYLKVVGLDARFICPSECVNVFLFLINFPCTISHHKNIAVNYGMLQKRKLCVVTIVCDIVDYIYSIYIDIYFEFGYCKFSGFYVISSWCGKFLVVLWTVYEVNYVMLQRQWCVGNILYGVGDYFEVRYERVFLWKLLAQIIDLIGVVNMWMLWYFVNSFCGKW